MVSIDQRVAKLLAFKVEGLKKKVCLSALALVKPVGPDWRSPGVKLFSKYDGQQFYSPLTYRPQISSTERSEMFKKVC